MPRYFIEVAYKGTHYSGFQVQNNAVTIQSEVENALAVYFQKPFSLTGASRTDAGVHALQNYFHVDSDAPLEELAGKKHSFDGRVFSLDKSLYNLNAILPADIVIKRILLVASSSHCRFDAVSRQYRYFIYQSKDPFLQERAYYYPYRLDIDKLNEAALIIKDMTDFTAFSKRNTQVKNFHCRLEESIWLQENDQLVYKVGANRFLRGMVKGLVGTMLRVGTGKSSLQEFIKITGRRDCSYTDFSVPAHALFLVSVKYNIQDI